MNLLENKFLAEQKGTALDESYVGQLTKKWAPMLEGVEAKHGSWTNKVMAILFENQSRYLQDNKAQIQLMEATTTSNVGSFLNYVFPVLRRVWPSLIANEIVSVQPMTAPIGGIFYYDLKYATTKGKVTAGQVLVKDFNAFYSSETIDQEVIGSGGSTSYSSTLDFTPVKTSTVIVKSVSGSGAAEEVLVSGVDNGSGTISGAGVSGTVDYSTGAISLTFTSSVPAEATVVAQYQYNSECNSNIPQVNIDITLSEIRATTRKLKAKWCAEAQDDLRAFHGIDAEAEIVAGVAAEITLEIDREIIEDLRQGSALSNSAAGYNISSVPAGVSQVAHILGFVTELTKASNKIHTDSKRGPANWLVTSPDVSAYIEQLANHGDFRPVFAPSTATQISAVEQPHTFGVYKFGTLSSKFVCYKDPYFPTANVGTGSGFGDTLVGYKGNTFLDAGYVFAPYIPLQFTMTFLNPEDMQAVKSARTRYAKKLVRPEFYRRVRMSGL